MENKKKESTISLNDIFRVIRKNLILIAIITLTITLLGGVYVFTRTPVYSANAQIVIAAYNNQTQEAIGYSTSDTLKLTNTVASLTKSTDILNDVIEDYNNKTVKFEKDGKEYEAVAATVFENKKLTDSKESRAYIKNRLSTSSSNDNFVISLTFTDVDKDFAIVIVNLFVDNAIEEFEFEDESNLGSFQSLKVNVMANKYAESSTYAGINKKLYLIIAFLAGVVISAVVVFVKEFMSNKFKTRDEIEAITDSLPIGVFIDNKNNKNKEVSLVEPTIQNYEPYNRLFTNIKYANIDNPYKVILFTSTIEDELKSYISSNLAACIKNNGNKVLLIDLDLRKPTVHKTFNVIRENGIIEYVAGEASKLDIIKNTESNVDIITSGKSVLNPFAVLESEKIKSLIEELKEEYDYIILDTPPLAICNDAKLIAKYSDGVIYNVSINQVKKKIFNENVLQLKELDINIIGYNITKLPQSSDRDSYYYYSYKYYGEAKKDSNTLEKTENE
ncbi:MAG: polysaccharide biosynthesis tyrosine autokinase [Acholeplasmatales bacterium]|nr:polysaccharide biosynthesis tyrosine autokinase [Acholeplasmatales bacterium]